jgi:hypothetical protein
VKVVAFTDGMWINSLMNYSECEIGNPNIIFDNERKTNIKKFKAGFLEALRQYPSSYWLNTQALSEFLNDI